MKVITNRFVLMIIKATNIYIVVNRIDSLVVVVKHSVQAPYSRGVGAGKPRSWWRSLPLYAEYVNNYRCSSPFAVSLKIQAASGELVEPPVNSLEAG